MRKGDRERATEEEHAVPLKRCGQRRHAAVNANQSIKGEIRGRMTSGRGISLWQGLKQGDSCFEGAPRSHGSWSEMHTEMWQQRRSKRGYENSEKDL